MMRRISILFVLLCFVLFSKSSLSKELYVLRSTPSGEDIQNFRQITVVFDRDVVPLGKADRTNIEIPITIKPKVDCEWRWIGSNTLSCEFSKKNELKKATKYQILIKKNADFENGYNLSEEYVNSFITERPKTVGYIGVDKWLSPVKVRFDVTFNQKVDLETAEKHIYFMVDGQRYSSNVYKTGEKLYLGREGLFVETREDLPLNSRVDLVIEPGIKSEEGGSEESIEKDESLKTFFTFDEPKLIGINCNVYGKNEFFNLEEVYKNEALCSPDSSVSLVFNTPVYKKEVFNNIKVSKNTSGDVNVFNPSGYEYYENYRGLNEIGSDYSVNVPIILEAQTEYQIKLGHGVNLESLSKLKSKLDNNTTVIKQIEQQKENVFVGVWSSIKNFFKKLFGFNDSDSNINSKTVEDVKKRKIADVQETEPDYMRDIFNRELKDEIILKFKTGDYEPYFDLKYDMAIMEKETDSFIPFKAVNIDSLTMNYDLITAKNSEKKNISIIEKPLERNVRVNEPFNLREIMSNNSGVIYGKITKTPSLRYNEEYPFFYQITPYNIFAKIGHFNGLVWVTDLNTGEPLANAKVELFRTTFKTLSDKVENIYETKTDSSGIAILPGKINFYDRSDGEYNSPFYQNKNNSNNLFVKVSTSKDLAILPIINNFEVDNCRISNWSVCGYPKSEYGHIKSWGITDKGIYKKGESVKYKIYVKEQDNTNFVPAKNEKYSIEIRNPQDEVVYKEENLTLSEFGSIAGEFKLDESAISGNYQFIVGSNYTNLSWYPLKFLVADFKVPTFKVETIIDKKEYIRGDNIDIDTTASLYSGGAYANASARIITKIKSIGFSSNNYLVKGFRFDSCGYNQDYQCDKVLSSEYLKLDEKGTVNNKVNLKEDLIYHGKINFESAVSDDTGKNISSFVSADYFAVDRFVGLKATKWIYEEKENADVEYLVVDKDGKLVKNSEVDINIQYYDTKVVKVKSAGNTFVGDYTSEWVDYAKCNGKTSDKKVNNCTFKPEKAGRYKLIASVKDSKSNIHKTVETIWVSGSSWVTWTNSNDDVLEIIPSAGKYNVGDMAEYMVMNPYPNSYALITIERFGIIKQWVQKFDNNTPMIKFKIEPDYVPGFYLSVKIISKRVDKPIDANNVDLGKPAFKIGYKKVLVDDPYKKIDINIETDKLNYKPGETVKVKIASKNKLRNGEKTEVAVIVLDEGVFDMIQDKEKYFDIYGGFYNLENLDLENFNLLLKLIGRQNVEKKGSNPGGDGALYSMSKLELEDNSAFTRKNLKNVAYWNPSLILDKDGKTNFEFKLPDNLTSWKILVIANTKSDLMGFDSKTIKSSLPLQLNVNMPNQVSENDEFSAGFTVINKVDKENKITVNIKATGPIVNGEQTITKDIVLSNNGRESVFLKLKPTSFGEIKISASITDGENSDGLIHILTVNKARNIESAVNYGTSDKDKVTEDIQIPNDIYTDVGGLSTTLSPTMLNNIEGSFVYMRDYPYSCWEQRLSKAAMFAYYKKLKPYLSDDLKWEEKEDLTQKTLDIAYQNQAENGGMAYYIPSNIFVSPYLSVYTAMVFNWLEEEGYKVDKNVEKKLHKYLSDLLRKEAYDEYYDPKMDYTIKAMTLYVLSKYNEITDSDIMRYKDKFDNMSLLGKSYYLLAFDKIIGNEKDSKKMINNILSFADFRSGRAYFEETLDTNFFVILDSSLRTNCIILNTMTELSQNKKYEKIIGDMPFKVIKGINDTKGSRYYFYNTQENVFCSKAFGSYSEKYESETPNMKLNVLMNEDNFGDTSFTSFKDKPYTSEYKFKNDDGGKAKKLTIEKDGVGSFYYANRITYASKNIPTDRINSGIDIRKECSVKTSNGWKLLNFGDSIKRGDLIRVDIYLSTPALRSFVVVEDSVLGGLEPVNRDLATSSIEDSNTGNEDDYPKESWLKQHSDWYEFSDSRWSFYHKELNFDKVRFYSEYLYAGNYHLTYTAQAIAEGIFKAVPIKAEEMYNPDIFGKGLPFELKIEE